MVYHHSFFRFRRVQGKRQGMGLVVVPVHIGHLQLCFVYR